MLAKIYVASSISCSLCSIISLISLFCNRLDISFWCTGIAIVFYIINQLSFKETQ
jgi:hypothetical protein